MTEISKDIDVALSGVFDVPYSGAKAVFSSYESSLSIFREEKELTPKPVPGADGEKYWPWGADNKMPYNIIDLVEADETLSTCLKSASEIAFGSGLRYETEDDNSSSAKEVAEFFQNNRMAFYLLGTTTDVKFFNFAVSVIILNKDHSRIVSVRRKNACYCRFSEFGDNGTPLYVYYANWKSSSTDKVEKIPLLDFDAPLLDLRERAKNQRNVHKYAIVCRIPNADNPLYPIPNYGAIFRSRWYDIKQLIGLAKLTKLKNSAPIRYHIEVSKTYWKSIFEREKITDVPTQLARVAEERRKIIKFLTGLENSGKVWFSEFYRSPDGQEVHDVVINKIDTEKEGGDWASDLQEAINVICFTLGIHSNLVGSIPGKSSSNNSGSDKRELYTIVQAMQLSCRELLFDVHRLIIAFNGWTGYKPVIPFVQLTTLDSHKDSQTVTNK